MRCAWAKHDLDIVYHDERWGKPCHDEKELFAMLMLEGMQAGLSWSTILQKEKAMREAYHDFDIDYLCHMSDEDIAAHMENPRLLRNKLKISGLRKNGKAYLALCEKYGSLHDYLWAKVDYQPIDHAYSDLGQVPAQTDLSVEISRELKKLGFVFVGPVIIYAYMQAVGLVNDHVTSCQFR